MARGVEVAAEAVGAHVGPAAGVEGEEGADVVGRGGVPGVEAALEDEAALVRGAHDGRGGGRDGRGYGSLASCLLLAGRGGRRPRRRERERDGGTRVSKTL